jgi:hypothetical protein
VAVSPEELGLGLSKFMPSVSFMPLPLARMGFKSVNEAWGFMTGRLAARRGDTSAVVCEAKGAAEELDGFLYDRRPPTHCHPWQFKKGQPFTVVAFNQVLLYNPTYLNLPLHRYNAEH